MGAATQTPHVFPAAMRIMRALREARKLSAIGDCPTVHSARTVMMRGYDNYGSEDVVAAGKMERTDDEIAKVERNEVCPVARRQPRLLPSDGISSAPPFDRNASSSSQSS